jgi:hypothetical protein
MECELRRLQQSIEARPRSSWSVDDRNALMALHLYLDSRSQRGDRRALECCSAPAVQDVLIAEEMRAMGAAAT